MIFHCDILVFNSSSISLKVYIIRMSVSCNLSAFLSISFLRLIIFNFLLELKKLLKINLEAFQSLSKNLSDNCRYSMLYGKSFSCQFTTKDNLIESLPYLLNISFVSNKMLSILEILFHLSFNNN